MTSNNRYDVIIIGTGAGGGTLAHRLAPTGKRILLLERGDYVPREKDNWSSRAVNVDAQVPHERSVARQGRQAAPSAHELLRRRQHQILRRRALPAAARKTSASCGTTAASRRRGRSATTSWSRTTPRPNGCTTSTASAATIRPTRGRARRTRIPPVSHEPRIQHLHDDLARAGLRPFHVPLGIMLDEQNPHASKCIRCDTCDGFPVPGRRQERCAGRVRRSGARASERHAADRTPRSAARDQRVRPRSHRRRGRARRRSGDSSRPTSSSSSCGAINSAALLLRSANDRHPRGLANGSDVVGRHYMGHINSVLLAISKTPNPTVFQKTLGVNDFYFGDDDFPFPMGHISFVGKLDAVALSAGAPPFVPGMTLDLMAKHSLDFWLTSEDLPDPDNRVTLDRDGNIVLRYTPNNGEGHRRLIAKLEVPAAAH